MKYHLVAGRLVSTSVRGVERLVTADYVRHQGLVVARRALIWYLAYGEWPEGYVYSIDATEHPRSLRIRPAKDIGRFTPGLREQDR